ncbi:OBSCN [Mytilus coruscus]|uniref:OBSCN n=1 Tax=Mytilus coruscus TaxID=42192 RepID=A0A6J8CHW2_MYTCO|nr:OBSCN [Mytilus coruscus]
MRELFNLYGAGDPPVVILRDLPNEVKIGDEVIIECTATSVSHFQVHWLKVTNEIKTEITPEVGDEKYGLFTEKIPSLVIKNVEESDDASYICYASNRFGDSERKQTDLKVTGDVITSELKETLCIECQDITFFCEVYANNLEVKWFKEEEEITKTNDKYIIDSKDKVHKLTVKQVVLQDAGNYCILVKDKRSTASLIVLADVNKHNNNIELHTNKTHKAPLKLKGILSSSIRQTKCRYK